MVPDLTPGVSDLGASGPGPEQGEAWPTVRRGTYDRPIHDVEVQQ
jgi:hypothetical protein